MTILFTDDFSTTLAVAITNTAIQLQVAAGAGSGAPALDGVSGAYIVLTIEDTVGNKEKIRCDYRSGDIFGSATYPLQRGYGGTTSRNWSSGDVVDIRWNAAAIAAMQVDTVAAISAAITAHTNLTDPHPQYSTAAEVLTATAKFNPAANFLPHAAATPNMTVLVDAGAIIANGTLASQSQQVSGTFTAPGSNSRIDRVVIDSATGAISVVTGTVSASPVAPAIPAGKLPCCQIGPFLPSTTAITDSMITDERTPWGGVQPGDVQTQKATAFTTTGTAPAFVLTTTPLAPWIGVRTRLNVTFHADGTTGSNTINPDGRGNFNLKQYDSTGAKVAAVIKAGMNTDLLNDGTDVVILNSLPTMQSSTNPPVRQTVLSGPVDSNGFSAFGGSTGSSTVTASGTLKATCYAGSDANYTGSIVNPSWTGLSTNGQMYLFLDITSAGVVTTTSSTVPQVCQQGGTPANTNGLLTVNWQEGKCYLGNGSAAPQAYRVAVGEVKVAGGIVTAITWYALMGRYVSADAAWPAAGTAVSVNHNIGCMPASQPVIEAVCQTSELGYLAGDVVIPSSQPAAGFSIPHSAWKRRNSAGFTTGASASLTFYSNSNGSWVTGTTANWKYRITVNRGW